MKNKNLKYSKQKGIALIMVLLVVALVAIIATGITSKQNLSSRRTGNLLNNEQAYLYLLAAEDVAKEALVEDARDNNTDTLDENWAVELPPWPVEGGLVSGSLKDLQSRFNLNNLVDNSGNPVVGYTQAFQALLSELKNPPSNDVYQAVVDWMDENLDATAPSGAEDGEYLNRVPAYVAANNRMANASELIKVNGFNYALYKDLHEHVITLPVATPLNINTATAKQISMLSNQISLSQAENVVKDRGKGGFKNIQEFMSLPEITNKNVNQANLSLSSNYFLLSARAVIGNSKTELYSLIYRENHGNNQIDVKVLSRSQREIAGNT